ncbi:MAG: sugar transferase [Actinomycetota bacterium]|nr:sugar transferase [Actinomycetota bacterium]
MLDIVLGSALAIAALPVMAACAVAVCISLRTWHPFFFQQRVGRGGRLFTLPKLRTLPPDAPRSIDKYALSAVRTTRVGRFLRRTHLDELPQLILVPIGVMSLVGPRPEMPWLLASYDPAFVAARSTVRPGCTGLWQIGPDASRLIGEVPEYDLYYLTHMGLHLDVWIICRSALMIATGRRYAKPDVRARAGSSPWK